MCGVTRGVTCGALCVCVYFVCSARCVSALSASSCVRSKRTHEDADKDNTKPHTLTTQHHAHHSTHTHIFTTTQKDAIELSVHKELTCPEGQSDGQSV